MTFAAKESVNNAIALSGTMFYSRPIKVHFSSSLSWSMFQLKLICFPTVQVSESHMITSGVMSQTRAPQVITGS